MTDKITYTTTYDNFPHFRNSHPDDPYILTGHFKKEYIQRCVENNESISRTGENIIPDYIVYECDNLPLETQLEIINKLDKTYVRYITFSGHKSYHVLFQIKTQEDITKEEFRAVAHDVLEYYDLLKTADNQCLTLGRLSRNPDGFNPKYNCRQTCIYDNPDCKTLDLTENVEVIRQEIALNKAWEEERRKKSDNIFKKLAMSPEEVISRIKKPCEAKTGYDMWQNDSFPSGYNFLGCARGMYNICMQAGCDEGETIEFCRRFLLSVSESHPTNISKHTALNWKPPKTFRQGI